MTDDETTTPAPLPDPPHDLVPKRTALGEMTLKLRVDTREVQDVLDRLQVPAWRWYLMLAYRTFVVIMLIGLAAAHCSCRSPVEAREPVVGGVLRSVEDQEAAAVRVKSGCKAGGSGVIISPRSVLTAWHVIENCPSKVITLVDVHGTERHAVAVAAHPTDIAKLTLLETEDGFDTHVPLVGQVRKGDRVCFSPANPKRERQCGAVKDIDSDWRGSVKHDAPTDHGNSGSGMYNDDGALVGIVVTCFVLPGLDFCVPTGGGTSPLYDLQRAP